MNGGISYFLTINAGSSSIKFCLYDSDTLEQKYKGTIAGIGFDTATFSVTGLGGVQEIEAQNHHAALSAIQKWLASSGLSENISAVGHRVVHGGPKYFKSCVIDSSVISDLRNLIPFDPEHLPSQIALIEQLHQDFPAAIPIACFDTAFFHDLPIESKLLPIPRKYESEGLRRFGFHGLSYSYLLQEFERVAGTEAANGKIIFAHLGNGVSLAALNNSKPVDTSMGLTPAGGVPMSTRSGDLDPGVLMFLAAYKHMSPEQINHMVSFESGLLGLSETTSDMEKLLSIQAEDLRAMDAVNIFCYQVRKCIGAYAAALGGLNSLIFSGGMGEASAAIRTQICDGLDFLGVSIDPVRNEAGEERISVDDAVVGVHVFATNEAMAMARDMAEVVKQAQA